MSGAFVCVVGPSGAGKDTLIAGAREALAGDDRFCFPRRVVTRQASDAEDHDTVSAEHFEQMRARREFALFWRAHGLSYGISAAVDRDLEHRRVVVCNLSRRAIADAERRFATVRTVLVTAPRDVLRSRILARGREDEAELDRRLDREADFRSTTDLIIENVGAVEDHVAALADFLRALVDER